MHVLDAVQVDFNVAAVLAGVGAISAAMGAFLADRRFRSGSIKTSEALTLWAESGKIRSYLQDELKDLRTRLVGLEQENQQLRTEVATLRIENAELRARNETITNKATRLAAQVEALERRSQREIDHSDTGGAG